MSNGGEQKLLSSYSFRIPPELKAQLDAIPNSEKRVLTNRLNRELRIQVAKAVHMSKFRPEVYLNNTDCDDE